MEQSLDFHKKELWTPIADENELSPFTRVDPGINNILKPGDVHDGGNLILRESGGNIKENMSGKLLLLSNLPMERLFTYDVGSSFSAPMVTNILGKIANKYPN
ncbi:S8 family serine peptidase [Fundicoccus sp. Sow4_D5]|uniref:S8 family serine peptidase n=1 Tax=Fundicoccus sp. Sow4_D5 TaxID=3438782 RepID=UPI003F9395D0